VQFAKPKRTQSFYQLSYRNILSRVSKSVIYGLVSKSVIHGLVAAEKYIFFF
jgi:hypothetical protein